MDRQRLIAAFELLGLDLRRRGAFVEIAVYGGSAIMLQFDWRKNTEDVGAVVREGYAEQVLAPSVARVASEMGLEPDWLNNAVGMFTPLEVDPSAFLPVGTYPSGDTPGLRVVAANPRYLLAMKLHALETLDRGGRDLADARKIAADLGVADVRDLAALHEAFFGEAPGSIAAARFPSVLKG